jgi:hypothetical protein
MKIIAFIIIKESGNYRTLEEGMHAVLSHERIHLTKLQIDKGWEKAWRHPKCQ